MTKEPRLIPPRKSGALGLFIKSTLHDLQPFLFLQEDLRRFCRITGPVIVSVPDAHLAKFHRHMMPGHRLVSDGTVARAANICWSIRDNWYTQQLVKLCASEVMTTEAFLVLDSNTVINAEFDESTFQVDGRWIYEIGDTNKHDLELERRTCAFLRMNPSRTLGFRPVNQVFARSELMGLRHYLETVYRASWGDILYGSCECATRLKSALWTEFQLYGAYVTTIAPTHTHALATKNVLMYFNPSRHLSRLPELLSWLAEHQPFMVKAHRQRPGVRLSARDYMVVATAIRTACRGGGVAIDKTFFAEHPLHTR